METAQKATASGAANTPSAAQLAKATFRRLALAKLEQIGRASCRERV